MRKSLLFAALLAAPAMLMASSPSPFKAEKENLFGYAYRCEGTRQADKKAEMQVLQEKMQAKAGMKKVSGPLTPESTLPSSYMTGFLEGPDGSIWYYTYNPVIEERPIEGGYEGLTEKVIKEYEYSIYTDKLELVGTIRDKIEANPDLLETKPTAVLIGASITKKFFNIDNNYEVIVGVAMNRDLSQNPYPTVNYHSYVYSIGGEKTEEGYDKKIAEIDGYLVDGINAAKDKWSENFYLTFLSESCGNTEDYEQYEEWLNSCVYNLSTYTKASYNGSMSLFHKKSISLNNLPGDQMNCPFLLTYLHNGKACFAYSEYEKPFWLTQGFNFETGEYTDPIQNEGNNLVISIYNDNYGTPEMIQQTKIPVEMEKNLEKALYTFYGVGNLLYNGDINYGDFLTDDVATFVVSKEVYVAGNDDSYVTSYYVYDNSGEQLITLAEHVDAFIELSDVNNEKQICFIYYTNEAYNLKFVDFITGNVDAELGQFINGKLISTSIDRVPYGNSYRYIVSMMQGEITEDNNVWHSMYWLDSDCEFIEEHRLNLGPDIANAEFYIDASVINPYIFNTDDKYEYVGLVKRYVDAAHTSMAEYYLILNTDETVAEFGPDVAYGDLRTLAPLLDNDKKSLYIMYYNGQYTATFYSLPFTKFTAGGTGTAEDPYLISTAGDLAQIASTSLTAHYKLVNDIDCSNAVIPMVNDGFQGSIDGDGHTIRNIDITNALFNRLDVGAQIKNINFNNVTVTTDGKDRAGVIAVEATAATLSNIHITGLNVNNENFDGYFGSLVGQGVYNSVITKCSVANASINLPKASVGGICCDLRTGISISECSFVGSINGRSDVGGIAGISISGTETISDCHVDADIVARNTVGGIIGTSARGRIVRCYVEGTIEATAPNQWTDAGPCAGGIVGTLTPAHESAEGMLRAPAADTAVVADNFVNLTSIKGYVSEGEPAYAQQRTTMHRIIGSSRVNGEPDPRVNTDAEDNIANNFAISTLAIIDSNIEDADTTTEGKSVTKDELNNDWFASNLGFEYGEDKAWNQLSGADPSLNHEIGAFFDPAVFTPEENTTFEAPLVIISREALNGEEIASDFSFESTDEEVAAPTGMFRLEGNTLYIEFQCSKVGTATVTVNVAGTQANCTVNSKESGVEDIAIDNAAALTYNGNELRAPGCTVSLYNTAGVLVASGQDYVATAGLQKGIYIAVAQGVEGRSTLKIAVR